MSLSNSKSRFPTLYLWISHLGPTLSNIGRSSPTSPTHFSPLFWFRAFRPIVCFTLPAHPPFYNMRTCIIHLTSTVCLSTTIPTDSVAWLYNPLVLQTFYFYETHLWFSNSTYGQYSCTIYLPFSFPVSLTSFFISVQITEVYKLYWWGTLHCDTRSLLFKH